MRTNIDIDDKLLKEAMKVTKLTTKKDVVNAGLLEIINAHRRQSFKDLQGKVTWIGDLDKMRTYDKWNRS